jgi:signal transduction histidine kinase
MQNIDALSENELRILLKKVMQEKKELEEILELSHEKVSRSKQRTIDVFGKMVDNKKMQRIISWQNEELETRNAEIEIQKKNIEHTYQKFRNRTIDLFGKMIDLKKAYNVIKEQKEEIESQRKLLNETVQSKDKFFNILAHDLKNPIAGFLGLTKFMVDKNNNLDKETLDSFIDTLHSSSKQLHSLLENLLHWARAQTGSLKIKPKKLDINKIIDDSINQVQTNAQLKEIKINKKGNFSCTVYADEETLNTVLRNLLSNAIKYSYCGNTIDIFVLPTNNKTTIKITDYGVGIPKNKINTLFDLENAQSLPGTNEETGTGLGLILCKEFIELNGGKIDVDSKEGEFTTFSISIPMHKA